MMNMKKITCTAMAALTLSANTMAATTTEAATANASTTTTSIADYYQQLKDSPIGLLYLNETVIDRKMDGLTSDNIFYLDYKFGKNKVSFIPSFNLDNKGDNKDAHIEYSNTQLRYTRYDLLTEAENGVKLDAQLRTYIMNDNSRVAGTDAIVRPKIEMKKTWGKFSLFNDTSYYMYQTNENKAKDTKKSRLLVQVSPAYQITDKLAVAIDVVGFYETFEAADTPNKKMIELIPQVGYDFDSGISVTGYVDVTPLTSKNQVAMGQAEDWVSKATFGTVLTYKFF